MTKSVSLVPTVGTICCCIFAIDTVWAQPPSVSYGVVTKVNPIDVGGGASRAGAAVGALAGGVLGYQVGKGSTRGKKRRGVAAGSTVGGLVGNQAVGGGSRAFEYTVKLMDGNSVTITTEQGRIDTGDCVAIEQGDSANIRRVSEVHCQTEDAKPSAEHVAEAKECEATKAAMLQAEGDEALNEAVRKARLACEE